MATQHYTNRRLAEFATDDSSVPSVTSGHSASHNPTQNVFQRTSHTFTMLRAHRKEAKLKGRERKKFVVSECVEDGASSHLILPPSTSKRCVGCSPDKLHMEAAQSMRLVCNGDSFFRETSPTSINSCIEDLACADLRDNQLDTFPAILTERCVNLRQLTMARNRLTHLPNVMTVFTTLELLDLRSNRLTHLPPTLFLLPQLKVLLLGWNQLESLESLPLMENDLDDLPCCLHELDLSHNKLNRIPSAISRFKSLRVLDLSHNRLNELPSGMEMHCFNYSLSRLQTYHPNSPSFNDSTSHTTA